MFTLIKLKISLQSDKSLFHLNHLIFPCGFARLCLKFKGGSLHVSVGWGVRRRGRGWAGKIRRAGRHNDFEKSLLKATQVLFIR